MEERLEEHLTKRRGTAGRSLPAILYLLNVALWFLTGIVFDAGQLLWLVTLALPAIALYTWRTRWNRISR